MLANNKNESGPISLSIAAMALACAALSNRVAIAQEEVVKTLDEIVIVGTRRQGRTAVESAVPVDVFNRQDIDSVSSDDMLDIINRLVPSFQVQRFAINDGSTFIRPPTLRGLSADKILVLVNGKRRHRSALVVTGRDGANGPDLATIPSIALKSIEVLRDGASALYGSDAIAGVFNFNLKDNADGGEVRLQTGQYTEGNERGYLLSFNQGISLGGNGFINISAEYSDNEPTSRGGYFDQTIAQSGLTPMESAQVSGLFDHDMNPGTPDQQRYGPDALTEVYDSVSGEFITLARGSDGIPDDTDTRYADNLRHAEISDSELVMIWGEPDRDAIRTFINAGYTLDGGSELYGWLNYSDSNSDGSFFHRRVSASHMAPMRMETGEIYNPRSMYPAGFTPRFAGNVIDAGVTGGFRGEFNSGLTYDFSGRWGESTLKYTLFNSMNASFGPDTQTSFNVGDLASDETEFNADFSWPVDIGWASDLNIAFGLAYRDEGYDLVQGEPASYSVGDYGFADPWNFEIDALEAAAGQNGGSVGCFIPGPQFDPTSLCHPGDPIHTAFSAGSNGFAGYGPVTASTYNRDSWAAYFEFEADLTDSFLASLAGRYEDFSDFGSNFSWRVAARWRANEALTLRGSAGTGFRAPTPGQISTSQVFIRVFGGAPETNGLFPPQSPASQMFGSVPLTDETSTQFTLGIVVQPTDTFTMTLDYYFIALDNRIWVSSFFPVSPPQRALLQALGVPGSETLAGVQFFTNDMDTESSGFDLVATYNIDWRGGNTMLSLAGNANTTKVTRRTDRQTDPANPDPVYYLRDRDVFQIENGEPQYRVNFTGSHSWASEVTATVRANLYGDYTVANRDMSVFMDFNGKVYWDADVMWVINDTFSVTVGANNIFDTRPDTPPTPPFCCGNPVHDGAGMDWQGSYYYFRGSVRWN